MKMPAALKPLVVAAALAVVGVANATVPAYEYELPMTAPLQVAVVGGSFSDTFGFTVSSTSSFSGAMSSTGLDWSIFSIKPLTIGSIDLNIPGLVTTISNVGNNHTATFSAASLAAGDYILTVSGTASRSTFGPFNGPRVGAYSIYGNLAPVPEPESYAMFLAGLGIIGAVVSRRQKSI